MIVTSFDNTALKSKFYFFLKKFNDEDKNKNFISITKLSTS